MTLGVLGDVAYAIQAKCPAFQSSDKEPTSLPARASPWSIRSFFGARKTVNYEVNTTLLSALNVENRPYIHYNNPNDQRQFESAYARELAQLVRSNFVVFVSRENINRTSWVRARLYDVTGRLAQQALVRPEEHRMEAAGRFLATGEASPIVMTGAAYTEMTRNLDPFYVERDRQTVRWFDRGWGWAGTLGGLLSLAAANELNDSRKFNDQKIRALTGNDSAVAALESRRDRRAFGAVTMAAVGASAIVGGLTVFALTEFRAAAAPSTPQTPPLRSQKDSPHSSTSRIQAMVSPRPSQGWQILLQGTF